MPRSLLGGVVQNGNPHQRIWRKDAANNSMQQKQWPLPQERAALAEAERSTRARIGDSSKVRMTASLASQPQQGEAPYKQSPGARIHCIPKEDNRSRLALHWLSTRRGREPVNLRGRRNFFTLVSPSLTPATSASHTPPEVAAEWAVE